MKAVRNPRLETAAWRFFVAGLTLHLVLSAHALITLGYPYEAPLLGPFPFKIHPGTYLMLAALLCAWTSRGHPLRSAWASARQAPLLAVHLSVMVTCLMWVLYRHGSSGAAFIVDTHWMPAFAALTLLHIDDRRRASLLRLLAVFLFVNAVLALAEYAAHTRLIPLHMPGQEVGFGEEEHFRSSAFMGHPLVNAKVTATLLPIAFLLPWRGLWRWLHVCIATLALLAFGGRAALATALAVYGLWFLCSLALQVVRGRFTYLQLTGGSVLLLLGTALLVGVVIATGVGERIFANLYVDSSASVRLRVWAAYDFLTSEQLWFGISARDIDVVALRLGLDPKYEAIENGWIYLSMQFGLLVFGLWVIGFGCLMVWVLRMASPLVMAAVLVYLIVSSTSNAFASKTITQGVLLSYAVASGAQRRLQRQRAASLAAAQAAVRNGRRTVMSATGRHHAIGPWQPGPAL